MCPDCCLVYEDSCDVPERDVTCRYCMGLSRPVWNMDLQYKQCCVGNVEMVTLLATFQSYRLAGEAKWGLCRTCKRRQIYLPKRG